jgi:hypothetical protein
MSFSNMAIRLLLALLYLTIGVGFWVRISGRDSLWTKAKRALKLEKEESMDLINALVRPNGARIMLDVLQRLAMIDKNLDEREKGFIQEFADRWNIKIDFVSQFDQFSEQLTEQLYIDLRSRLSDYLSISPDKKQASQFLDIIKLLIHSDKGVSNEEQLMTDEIVGMIESYVDRGDASKTFNVIVVPQNDEERAAVLTLFPNVELQPRWGGEVVYAGEFHSQGYAEMISEKYQALNLFSTVKTS